MASYATPDRQRRTATTRPIPARHSEGAQSVQTTVTREHSYLLGHSDEEIRRLIFQSSFLNDLTRHMLEDCGIAPGMRVLDIGSGAGDVALLAAELVGPKGEVVGIDINAKVLDVARARASEAGLTNVRFIEADLKQLDFIEAFDAAVVRLILMHSGDPEEAIRAATQTVRPGGIVAFQDLDLQDGTVRAFQAGTLPLQVTGWIRESAARAGLITDLGYRLFHAFVAAGLPEPQLRAESAMGGGADWGGTSWVVETVRAFMPAIIKTGVASAEEIEIDTLAERLRAELVATGGVVKTPDLVSAWTRKP
jgi:SAM-dependent methyltransferase